MGSEQMWTKFESVLMWNLSVATQYPLTQYSVWCNSDKVRYSSMVCYSEYCYNCDCEVPDIFTVGTVCCWHSMLCQV